MDKAEAKKLFNKLYSINPKLWNQILNKSGTKYSNSTNAKDTNVINSKSFKELQKQSLNEYKTNSGKQSATVNKPKSIRINNETLGKYRSNDSNKSDNTTFVDSAAISSFTIENNEDGTKDVTINFTNNSKDYLYPDVPKNVADGMYSAPSKGSYVYNVISKYSDYNNPKVQSKIRGGN